jgi:hypothetical protein
MFVIKTVPQNVVRDISRKREQIQSAKFRFGEFSPSLLCARIVFHGSKPKRAC